MINKIDPKPCPTPDNTLKINYIKLLTFTYCNLSLKYDSNHFNRIPLISYAASFLINNSIFTISKALTRSV